MAIQESVESMNQLQLPETHNRETRRLVFEHVFSGDERVAIITAAPGSGKSTALLNLALTLLEQPNVQRIAIAAQTNNQATDLALKLLDLLKAKGLDPKLAYRFASERIVRPVDFDGKWVTKTSQVEPASDAIIISTAAKWGQAIAKAAGFQTDFVLVDEAYQMAWSTFMQVSCLGPRFILIGDEGQIDPVVSVDASRWHTAKFPPHWPAPKTLQNLGADVYGADYLRQELEYCWRLPSESISYIDPFYKRLGLEVKPVARKGDRFLTAASEKSDSHPLSRAISFASHGEPVLVTVPDSETGAPLDADKTIAMAIRDTLAKLFESGTGYQMLDRKGSVEQKLNLDDIAICSTKRAMNSLIENVIQDVLKNQPVPPGKELVPNYGLRVDTPERLQGLEFKVVLAVHPLSTATRPSEFDLATGRLCVMASRHQIALFMFSREHILSTLDRELPNATQAPGLHDGTGEGHKIHRGFIKQLQDNNRIVRLQA
jgi:hypothetical protein